MQEGTGSSSSSDSESEREETLEPTTPRSITHEKWLSGYPVPENQAPEGMAAHLKTKFAPQPVKQLGPNELQEAVTKWQKNHKARPSHARLLKFETLANSKKLMAAYLGFSNLPQLFHFIDFIGKFKHMCIAHLRPPLKTVIGSPLLPTSSRLQPHCSAQQFKLLLTKFLATKVLQPLVDIYRRHTLKQGNKLPMVMKL